MNPSLASTHPTRLTAGTHLAAATSEKPVAATTATLLLAASLTVMANATISPALPAMKQQFASLPGAATLVGLVMTLPSLSIALAAAPLGAMADRIGKWRLLVASLLVYAAGGASGFIASSFTELLIGRVVLGLGVAGTMTAVTAMAADLFRGPARDRFVGRQGAAQSLGGVVFLLAGGLMATVSWRHPFLLYLLALGVAAAALLFLQGATSVVPANRGPGLEPTPMPHRALAAIAALAIFSMAVFYLVPTKLPFLLAEMGEVSPVTAAMGVAALTLTAGLTALGFQRVATRLDERQRLAIVFAGMGMGYGLMATASSLPQVLLGSAVAGVGMGWLMPTLTTSLFQRVPASRRGQAAGWLTSAVFAGQFLSPLLVGPTASSLGLAATFGVYAAVLLVAAAAVVLARGR